MEKQICIVPRLKGLGGMVSFQAKFIEGLKKRGITFTFTPSDPANTTILIIGGWRKLLPLIRARHNGIHIVQRLNGMNWLHTVQKTPFRAWLRCESANLLLNIIRKYICHTIIYQSAFSQSWWNDKKGKIKKPTHVFHNGVNLDVYAPNGVDVPPSDCFRILLVEGHLTNQNSSGLITACKMLKLMQERVLLPLELMVAGDVPLDLQMQISHLFPQIKIQWLGVVNSSDIPALDRSAHMLFSADLNAACPNSVIEALACGLPVVAFDTGALSELVPPSAGAVVPYGSNHWKLEDPDIKSLTEAALPILKYNNRFREGARAAAVALFSLDSMIDAYLEVLLR